MNIRNYINELTAEIDAAREDIWDTDSLDQLRPQTDRYGAALDRQTKRAELWQAIMDYREEEISEEDLFMFMQTFDKKLDYYGFINLMGALGYVI